MLGYPVLCTDILPYQGDLPVTRIANKHRDWVRAIREMVADRAALQRAGEALRQAVLRDWMLEDHLDDWKRAWLPVARPQRSGGASAPPLFPCRRLAGHASLFDRILPNTCNKI